MKAPKFTILSALIVMAVAAVVLAFYAPVLHEAERIRRANQEEYAQIFQRCSSIPELQQFIELYRPEAALESFDGEKVVSISCVTPLDGRYEASFNAPVTINSNGTYDLTGDVVFSISDSEGVFREIHANGRSEGPGVRLNATEWRAFVDRGADIESLRTFKRISLGQN